MGGFRERQVSGSIAGEPGESGQISFEHKMLLEKARELDQVFASLRAAGCEISEPVFDTFEEFCHWVQEPAKIRSTASCIRWTITNRNFRYLHCYGDGVVANHITLVSSPRHGIGYIAGYVGLSTIEYEKNGTRVCNLQALKRKLNAWLAKGERGTLIEAEKYYT